LRCRGCVKRSVSGGAFPRGAWEREGKYICPLYSHITPGIPQAIDVKALRFSPDGRMLIVAYKGVWQIVIAYWIADGKIAWTYEPQRTIGGPLLTTPLVFTPDGKSVVLATGERGGPDFNLRHLSRILFLDAASGEFLRSIDDIHVSHPRALALSRDGKWVATGTETGTKSQTTNLKTHQTVTLDNKDPVRIWDMETGKLARELPVHSYVWSLAFSGDGKYLFGAKSQIHTRLTMAVWDVESGKMVQEIRNTHTPLGLAVSPDGKRIAAACQDKLSIYEIMTGN
jgi:WD40 repeat protein